MSRQQGFTLLEILVVMALMGLMYALVPPMISTSGSTTELRAEARQLAAGLRKARSYAMANHQESTLTVDVEQHRFQVTGDAKEYALPKASVLSVYTAQSEAVENKIAAIRFFPDGSSTGGAISVANGSTKFRVDVDWLTGNVAILD